MKYSLTETLKRLQIRLDALHRVFCEDPRKRGLDSQNDPEIILLQNARRYLTAGEFRERQIAELLDCLTRVLTCDPETEKEAVVEAVYANAYRIVNEHRPGSLLTADEVANMIPKPDDEEPVRSLPRVRPSLWSPGDGFDEITEFPYGEEETSPTDEGPPQRRN